jgi:hypothetical protein
MKQHMVLLAGLAAALLLSLPAAAGDEAALVAVEGKVILSGNRPHTSAVMVAEGERLTLTGPLSEELRQLQNVPVRLVGKRRGSPGQGVGRMLEVLAYAPTADGYGKPPRVVVGVVVQQGTTWLLADLGSAHLYQCTGKLPTGLTDAAGAKVAVTGKATRSTGAAVSFVVESFQVVAAAGQYPLN